MARSKSAPVVAAPTLDWALSPEIRQAVYATAFANQEVAMPTVPATPTAIVPVVANATNAYTANILRTLLAGGDLEIDPTQLALAIATLERGTPTVAATPAARATGAGRVVREAPEARSAAIASGLPSRKIWRTKAMGDFLVGACNAAGGAVVRDTRTNADEGFGKVSQALAWLHLNHPDATVANATDAAKARIGSDGVAR